MQLLETQNHIDEGPDIHRLRVKVKKLFHFSAFDYDANTGTLYVDSMEIRKAILRFQHDLFRGEDSWTSLKGPQSMVDFGYYARHLIIHNLRHHYRLINIAQFFHPTLRAQLKVWPVFMMESPVECMNFLKTSIKSNYNA